LNNISLSQFLFYTKRCARDVILKIIS